MAKNFAEIGFSAAAKKLQEKHGSRKTYSRMESQTVYSALVDMSKALLLKEIAFIWQPLAKMAFPIFSIVVDLKVF
jgi:hypothetical protein